MITYQQLFEDIHKITEISNVFLYLIRDRAMCDTQITCDLFFDYVDRVNHHLELQENHLYSAILSDGDDADKKVAENFMSGSQEIKKIFKQYLKKWSKGNRKHELLLADYDNFTRETEEVFGMVLKRIQDETEHLYPLIRQLRGDNQQVA